MKNPSHITIRNAYYIKLGAGGKWADDAIERGLLRFGWRQIPIDEMHAGNWTAIRKRLSKEHSHKGTITTDTRRLRDIVDSVPGDVWVTFHDSLLWWCRPSTDAVGRDAMSTFRTLSSTWSCRDLNGGQLGANQIPGTISQLQGFRGTVCDVRQKAALQRLLNAEASPAFTATANARNALVSAVQAAIQDLHWKDFETLVDLVFRQAGWRRRSIIGKSMKYADIELEEPVTGDAYQVQVKASADLADFEEYAEKFSSEGFRGMYFVVHSPSKDLAAASSDFEAVKLVLSDRLGAMVVDGGLVRWVLDKIR